MRKWPVLYLSLGHFRFQLREEGEDFFAEIYHLLLGQISLLFHALFVWFKIFRKEAACLLACTQG